MEIPKGNTQADLVYKKTKQRDLMLTYLPPLTKKYDAAPLYFLIPGGGWHHETRQSMLEFSVQSVDALRNQGFAVVSIDYRVCTEGVNMRAIITDCFDALRCMVNFAEVMQIDVNRIVMSGHSAGAHLALMLAYAPQERFCGDVPVKQPFQVKAVAAMSPPTVLYDHTTNNLRDMVDVFVEKDTHEEREFCSPITYVSNQSPSTLLCAGTSDWLVFSKSSELLYEKLKEYQVDSELILSICGGHCFEQIHAGIEPGISMTQMQKRIVKFVEDRA